jgi:PilZ domain
METRLENRRKEVRHGIAANFQFVCGDNSEDICYGVTLSISTSGFGFLTLSILKEGQDIVVTKHDVPNLAGRKARVVWVKKGPAHYSAGVEFVAVQNFHDFRDKVLCHKTL